MRHHGFIVETFRQRAHHDGGPIAIIMRVAIDISGEAQGFQNSVGGGARQVNRGRERVDGGALQSIQFDQHLEPAIQGADRAGGLAAAVDGFRKWTDFRVHDRLP